jgi:TRAP-type C4-dicarboxylate transport system permease small subunit
MQRIIHTWNRIGIWIAGITLFLMMLLTAVDVCARYLFNHAILGSHDITELMMVIIIFMALSDTASSGGHICVEVVTSHLSAKVQQILKVVISLPCGVVAGIFAWRLGANAFESFQHMEAMPVLQIPIAPFLALSAIGCGMLSVTFMVEFYVLISIAKLGVNKTDS